MGVFDKIKNALFEEEYVEVEEKPKAKSKSRQEKAKKEYKNPIKKPDNKPIAKKIVLPEKEENPLDDMDDYKPVDEDFEIVPEREPEFKFPAIEEDDFKEETHYYSEPQIVEVVEKEEVVEERPIYHERKPEKKPEPTLYHSDRTSNISIHEYGGYEKKESKPVFRPSPIISPIYGILDKNYKKEEIIPKREVRLTSYAKEHMSVDDVRRKAFGSLADDIALDIDGKTTHDEIEEEKEEVIDDDNLLVDLSDTSSKPEVSQVTVGDAEEYFRDLGLEYNIDYKDSSKERATGRRSDHTKELEEVSQKEESETYRETTSDLSTDDNLFDLIDSMYEDENKE